MVAAEGHRQFDVRSSEMWAIVKRKLRGIVLCVQPSELAFG